MDKQRLKYLNKELKNLSNNKSINMLIYYLGVLISLCTIAQIYIISYIVSLFFIKNFNDNIPIHYFISLIIIIIIKSIFIFFKDQLGFKLGSIVREKLRAKVLNRIDELGPMNLSKNPATFSEIFFEQIEHCHMFVARFRPQIILAVIQPLCMLITVFYFNWLAGLILLLTAPLLPIFMIIIGKKTALISQQQLYVLLSLSNQLLDKLQGLMTVLSFNKHKETIYNLGASGEEYRERTMKLLKIAFFNSAVLEFITSVSIALMAVYFGFSFMGKLNFGYYEAPITLFVGFLCLTLSVEYYQPLRDLGTFYHDKSSAINAIDYIYKFLENSPDSQQDFKNKNLYKIYKKSDEEFKFSPNNLNNQDDIKKPFIGDLKIDFNSNLLFILKDVEIISHSGKKIAGPYSFTFSSQDKILLIGQSGVGKSSLISVLLGLYLYKGSITINGIEISDLNKSHFINNISYLGQNFNFENISIIDNFKKFNENFSFEELNNALNISCSDKFVQEKGLNFIIGDVVHGLSGGQMQRLALARTLLKDSKFLLLDEVTSNLDSETECQIINNLEKLSKGMLIISHSKLFIEANFTTYVVHKNKIEKLDNV